MVLLGQYRTELFGSRILIFYLFHLARAYVLCQFSFCNLAVIIAFNTYHSLVMTRVILLYPGNIFHVPCCRWDSMVRYKIRLRALVDTRCRHQLMLCERGIRKTGGFDNQRSAKSGADLHGSANRKRIET